MGVFNHLLVFFLTLSAMVLARPSLSHPPTEKNLYSYYPSELLDDIALKSLQSTGSLSLDSQTEHLPTQCSLSRSLPAVNWRTCASLIRYLSRESDFRERKAWTRYTGSFEWKYEGCNLLVYGGVMDDRFSKADIVAEMEKILGICQPSNKPEYSGTGGQASVGNSRGFVVQVVGIP
ncbi:hypothetical protein MMC28_004047 [Mycoblastus sanguinarius]|nr:hypothetical protein [Mycoblastus sanguinarius]